MRVITIASKARIKFQRFKKFILKVKEQYLGSSKEEILQAEFIHKKLEIQEQILENISIELHNNIAQVLNLVKLNIHTMSSCDSNMLKEKIADTTSLISGAICDLRNLSRSLNGDFIKNAGLIKSIEQELNRVSKISGLKTSLLIGGIPYKLSPEQELTLFRIFQEALNNIIKHSNASSINVEVNFDFERFVFKIIDNGCGFDVSSVQQSQFEPQGLGIKNIEKRCGIIGATCNITSYRGKETSIAIELPNITFSTFKKFDSEQKLNRNLILKN